MTPLGQTNEINDENLSTSVLNINNNSSNNIQLKQLLSTIQLDCAKLSLLKSESVNQISLEVEDIEETYISSNDNNDHSNNNNNNSNSTELNYEMPSSNDIIKHELEILKKLMDKTENLKLPPIPNTSNMTTSNALLEEGKIMDAVNKRYKEDKSISLLFRKRY